MRISKSYNGSISRVITVTYNTSSHIKHAYKIHMPGYKRPPTTDQNSDTYEEVGPSAPPQDVIEHPPYAPSTFTDQRGYVPIARSVSHQNSRKVAGIKPSRYLLLGVILWAISIVGYAVPNLTIMALASGLNFISFIIICIPCCAGHCWCPHDDHGCCYEEYR
jgi:hypothetical protein